jgi:predicted Zn-dependent protease
LFRRLKSEDQLAGVLGHEMGHVVGRHSNEQMANSRLWSGLAQGLGVLLSDGHNNTGAQIAQMVAQYKVMKFSRDDESESDALGVRFMIQAGYEPEALIGVMEILAEVSGGAGRSDFMSSHPSPENRMERIREVIAQERARR